MATSLTTDFGNNVFNDKEMKRLLDPAAYKSLQETIRLGMPLDAKLADTVAAAMRDWAVSKGATHYTHWFQPMNGITAGKHDAFLEPAKDGETPELKFSGKLLIKGEPDASSFPSGGLRATFEARGYTAWDPTSPAFVRDRTLFIPTAFCSYTGEALDGKTPLLRSMDAVSGQAIRVLKYFGGEDVRHVTATVGAEQEYFLIDREKYEKRLDLKVCGRTLFGAKPPKGQELDDHYCGRIRIKISEYMHALDSSLWGLGVFAKTKHNEVAPAQHELANVYSSANTACDHNQLTMEMMRIIAKERGLACLLHEKPFAFVNGSGKHNNWSLATDTGENLFRYKKGENNDRFFIFLAAVIKAVDEYQDLIRFSAASAGNDHRLGAHEAPPAIVSIFLGNELWELFRQAAEGEEAELAHKSRIRTGVEALPKLSRDDSDRNRTSPFAYTGDKFEFRMVGSSASIATANFVLNTAMADALEKIADRLDRAADPAEETRKILSDILKEHGRIIFNGNNYSDEWIREAESRGLENLTNTPDAIEVLLREKNLALFERFKVLSRAETFARHEISMESYSKTVFIELNTMLEMAKKQILPACIRYTGEIAGSVNAIRAAACVDFAGINLLKDLTTLLNKIDVSISDLEEICGEAGGLPDGSKKAYFLRDRAIPKMNELRRLCDSMEHLVSKDAWPFPDYTDLLFRV
ncbi:MAG: glutamine synthetase III [Oscillospiraceae bacterium]|nr:glutamine synthetase III [Oscillospiraceae bacterium]